MASCMGIDVYKDTWVWQGFVSGEITSLDALDKFEAVFRDVLERKAFSNGLRGVGKQP